MYQIHVCTLWIIIISRTFVYYNNVCVVPSQLNMHFIRCTDLGLGRFQFLLALPKTGGQAIINNGFQYVPTDNNNNNNLYLNIPIRFPSSKNPTSRIWPIRWCRGQKASFVCMYCRWSMPIVKIKVSDCWASVGRPARSNRLFAHNIYLRNEAT